VDFTSVAEAGVHAGLQLAGYTTQAHFLVNLGITDLLGRSPSDDPSYFPTVAGAQKLLSPAEMGELFKTIALLRGPLPPLSGFARGDLSRLL
jgi:SAM-dependent MidA family methyltransferase